MAVSTLKKEYLVEIVTSNPGAYVVPRDSYLTGQTLSLAKTGWTPKGILAYRKTGSASVYTILSNYYLQGNDLKLDFRNTYAADATVTLTVWVLYERA